ncbi:phosphomannomutase [Acinetobacter sp. ANC 4558]|uniref:phosphomannomutase/phosphoglucomutase n=1 Tax=Acinetobacter sp. ANC 4558 TaxID=1977876 RepID=UPI000A348FC9|nr:phosphomannomutase/phosphoglucomutase [Acinetobacter sp. ANC 4558]OTG86952.1 phosphomannomutase [Acinetobacter sp. ANC 4558]
MTTLHAIFPYHIFRAYDIRGKINVLTAQVVQAIAYGLIEQFESINQYEIVLGYDARLTSPSYAAIIADMFKSENFKVIEIGCCSSPMMYFFARQTGGNGIMVTASHNPKSDNGLKWMRKGLPPTPEMIQQVALIAHQYYDAKLQITNASISHQINQELCLQYQQALLSDIHLKRSFKIVLDGMHGSAGFLAESVLKKLGCTVISLRCNIDGNFPDNAPDPSKEQHLTQLKYAIKEQHADIGIALDGDGDRLVIFDENAQLITADRVLSLCAQICLEQHPHAEIVYDVKCSSMVRNTIQNLGGIPKMIRTGSTFLRKYLAHSNGKAVFGGEYAGHYVFNDGRGHGYDDGLYAALRILEYLSCSSHTTLSALFRQYPERCSTEDTYISTYTITPQLVLDNVALKSQAFDAQMSKIDGIRLDFKDGFGIIRASNTGEYFTVRFDADNPARLNDIRGAFAAMLSDDYPQIALDILDAQ